MHNAYKKFEWELTMSREILKAKMWGVTYGGRRMNRHWSREKQSEICMRVIGAKLQYCNVMHSQPCYCRLDTKTFIVLYWIVLHYIILLNTLYWNSNLLHLCSLSATWKFASQKCCSVFHHCLHDPINEWMLKGEGRMEGTEVEGCCPIWFQTNNLYHSVTHRSFRHASPHLGTSFLHHSQFLWSKLFIPFQQHITPRGDWQPFAK